MGLRIYDSTRDKKEIKKAMIILRRRPIWIPEAQLWVAEHYESGKYYPKNYRQSYLCAKRQLTKVTLGSVLLSSSTSPVEEYLQ
jgi:hypothetical protein